jgi:hypothetical protein
MEALIRRRALPYLAFGAVLALHLLFVLALLKPSTPRPERDSIRSIITTLILMPPRADPNPHVNQAHKRITRRTNATSISATPSIPAQIPFQPSHGAPPVDWAGEAVQAAASVIGTHKGAVATPVPSATHNFWLPSPSHHRGEQYTTDTGQLVVWVSDGCYQITRLPTPNVPDHVMVPMTVCPPSFNTPRGDLFDQLPEYQKYASK